MKKIKSNKLNESLIKSNKMNHMLVLSKKPNQMNHIMKNIKITLVVVMATH